MFKNTLKIRLLSCIMAVLMLAGAVLMTACEEKPVEPSETDAPDITDAPVTDAPATDAPATDAPVTDAPETEAPVVLTEQTIALNKNTKGIKVHGVRNLASDTTINVDWSASGIEFVATCEGDMTFTINSSAVSKSTAACYFRAYVDGEPWNNGSIPYYTVNGKTNVVLKDIPKGTHTIKLLKVTGYNLALADISSVTLTGYISEEAPADKDIYIEFIGDSITCAWGTLGHQSGNYTDQDSTLSYAYLLAEALDADYSMTALSGKGLLHSGNTTMNIRDFYGYASKLKDAENEYDFPRQADLIVYNQGANDEKHGIDHAEYKKEFKKWVEFAKKANGEDCKILFVWNMHNTNLYKYTKEVFDELGGEAAGYYIYRAKRTQNSAALYHPSVEEHAAYVPGLKEICEKILATPITATPEP